MKAIAGDSVSQYELALEMLDGEYYDNNPRIYNKKDKIERECCNQYFDEMGNSWLEKAAMNGNPDAQYRIWYERGSITTEESIMAFKSNKTDLFSFSFKNGSGEAIMHDWKEEIERAKALYENMDKTMSFADVVAFLHSRKYEWGESDGN